MAGQPDDRQVAGDFTTHAEQSALLPNVPALDGGAQILAAMEGLQQGLVRLERRCERFEHRFDALEVRLRAGEANTLARTLNSIVKGAGQVLEPLRSLRTGEVIEGFPETLAEINRMNSQPLNAILEELDQKLGGTLMERKRQLKLLCGVVTELV